MSLGFPTQPKSTTCSTRDLTNYTWRRSKLKCPVALRKKGIPFWLVEFKGKPFPKKREQRAESSGRRNKIKGQSGQLKLKRREVFALAQHLVAVDHTTFSGQRHRFWRRSMGSFIHFLSGWAKKCLNLLCAKLVFPKGFKPRNSGREFMLQLWPTFSDASSNSENKGTTQDFNGVAHLSSASRCTRRLS